MHNVMIPVSNLGISVKSNHYIRQGCLNKEYSAFTWILLKNFASFLSTPEHKAVHGSLDMYVSLSHVGKWKVHLKLACYEGIGRGSM